jgi:hypothetical protein
LALAYAYLLVEVHVSPGHGRHCKTSNETGRIYDTLNILNTQFGKMLTTLGAQINALAKTEQEFGVNRPSNEPSDQTLSIVGIELAGHGTLCQAYRFPWTDRCKFQSLMFCLGRLCDLTLQGHRDEVLYKGGAPSVFSTPGWIIRI